MWKNELIKINKGKKMQKEQYLMIFLFSLHLHFSAIRSEAGRLYSAFSLARAQVMHTIIINLLYLFTSFFSLGPKRGVKTYIDIYAFVLSKILSIL